MGWKIVDIPGSFGDKTVRLTVGIVDRPRQVLVLFHGVHSCASAEAGNKYAYLGSLAAQFGVLPVLVETSRRIRDRRPYAGDLPQWIYRAFGGKTFEQELSDAAGALQAVGDLYKGLALSLWGFSLGGLIALLLAGGEGLPAGAAKPRLEGLILTGCGDRIREDRHEALKLPILRDLSDPEALYRAAGALEARWCRAFYGTLDETFEESSARRLYDLISCRDKAFYRCEGVDHAFRNLEGSPSRKPLQDAVAALAPRWTAGAGR